MMKTGLFTGTFDPFTIGHRSIVDRALPLFDRLVIGVAVSRLKRTHSDVAQRVRAIANLYAGDGRVKVVAYSDLTIDLAHREAATFIVRGVRSAKDFEYERDQADINRRLGGVETLLLFSEPHLACVSSSLVRELEFFGHDVSEFLPEAGNNKEIGNKE